MKLYSNARADSIKAQIISQADTIRYLKKQILSYENENRMQAERIAELEAILFGAGVLNPDGSYKDDAATVLKAASVAAEVLK